MVGFCLYLLSANFTQRTAASQVRSSVAPSTPRAEPGQDLLLLPEPSQDLLFLPEPSQDLLLLPEHSQSVDEALRQVPNADHILLLGNLKGGVGFNSRRWTGASW